METKIREYLLDTLDLWTSVDKALSYQKNVPIANVSAELFCMWSDFYHPDSVDFKNSFDQKEIEILSDFNKVITEISKKTPNRLPIIDKFVLTDEWLTVSVCAKQAIDRLNAC